MNLNQIELTGEMLSGLYKRSLVEVSPLQTEKIIPAPEPRTEINKTGIRYLGENKRNIILLVSYPITGYLPDEQFSFLTSILNACKVSLADVAIINIQHQTNTGLDDINTQFHPKTLILFNIEPDSLQMPFRFPAFQVQAFDNCTYLLSPSLEELQADKGLKSKLWNCLQKIFLS